MGESFQDHSWIQDFEADFLQKVGLKILNWADNYGFFDFISVYLKTIDHLNLKLLIFIGILQVLRFDFQNIRILEIWTFTHVRVQWWNQECSDSAQVYIKKNDERKNEKISYL